MLAQHIAYCKAPALSTTDHGSRLEQLALWLFPHLPGLTCYGTNVFSTNGAQEVDVPMFNDYGERGSMPAFGSKLFIECKNYQGSVGGTEIAWFDHKLIQGNCSSGILLAANGVTGDLQSRTFGQGVVATALLSQRNILVVTLDDLAPIASTTDLRDLLCRRLMEISTGRPF